MPSLSNKKYISCIKHPASISHTDALQSQSHSQSSSWASPSGCHTIVESAHC